MEHFNHLGIFDFMYGMNFQTLINSIDSDFSADNEDIIVFKVISFLLFIKDYDSLNEKGRNEIDRVKEKFKIYKNRTLKYLSNIEDKEFIRLLSLKEDNLSINNKFELFNFVENTNKTNLLNEEIIVQIIENNI